MNLLDTIIIISLSALLAGSVVMTFFPALACGFDRRLQDRFPALRGRRVMTCRESRLIGGFFLAIALGGVLVLVFNPAVGG